ncbi:(2Fe-2S) ferredoxin domain-containing protein [bacterium]|nr:(2Fe-2S) ferredoxin domain-containing protein [bacterium]MBL7052226.1 (2Fe-2S) ferredoxin domain-containing protein [Candidatus Neomarinimicrobiota bacterium]
MPKLKIEDLQKIKQRVQQTTNLREGKSRAKITVHMGTCGIAAGARDIMDAVMEIIENNNVDDVIITTSGCAGLCSQEPMATVELPGQTPVKYIDLTKAKIAKIFDGHVMNGKIVADFVLGVGSEQTH